mmetsp:Transcript_8404/g.24100  ORF Transcript_8404/g.24100 Transcript_8404/m.24100 type:complete len:280 (+) Transcript_8404:508-1347(+)
MLEQTRKHTSPLHGGTQRLHEPLELDLLRLHFLCVGLPIDIQPAQRRCDALHQPLQLRLLQHGALLVQLVLGRVDIRLQSVAGLHTAAVCVVVGRKPLGLADHLLDLVVCQAPLLGVNGDVLLLAATGVVGPNSEDAVDVHFERHVNLGEPGRGRRDARQLKQAEAVVLCRLGSLPLKHLDQNLALVLHCRRENSLRSGWDSGVAGDHDLHHPAHGLQSKGQRCDIKKNQVLHTLVVHNAPPAVVSGRGVQDGRLHGGAHRHDLVGVDPVAQGLAAEEG